MNIKIIAVESGRSCFLFTYLFM